MSLNQVHARTRAHAEIAMVGRAASAPARCAHVGLLRLQLQACRDSINDETECTGCDLRPFCMVLLPVRVTA